MIMYPHTYQKYIDIKVECWKKKDTKIQFEWEQVFVRKKKKKKKKKEVKKQIHFKVLLIEPECTIYTTESVINIL